MSISSDFFVKGRVTSIVNKKVSSRAVAINRSCLHYFESIVW